MADDREEDPRAGRSAAAVSAGIVLSKLVGLVRQRVVAYYFGTDALGDVVAAAFRIGNIVQNLLGEGTLSASFIPVYARLRAEDREKDAAAFAQSCLGLLAAAVVVLSAIGIALAPQLSVLVAGGFDAGRLTGTATLVRVVFPMTGLLVLCAWALGVLNAHRSFFLPYAAPVVWSVAQIAALVFAGSYLLLHGEALALALAWGALAGAALELGLLLARARPLVGRLRLRFEMRSGPVREALSRLPAVLLGRGVIQLSGLVDTLLVSFLGTGANAAFGYAQTIYLLPMSVLGTGEAAASLPEMAAESVRGDRLERSALLRRRLGMSLRRVLVLCVPTIVALSLFGSELVTLLLRTGRFDAESTARVAEALQIYGLAIAANASQRLFATTCFALGDTRRPAALAVVRVVVSTLLALVLMRSLGVAGVVLGAATAAWLEAFLLGRAVQRALDGLGLEHVPFARLGVLALATSAAPLGLRAMLPAPWQGGFLAALLVLATAAASFALASRLLGLLDLRGLIRR